MRRGEIWWVDFGEPFGSEPGFLRPALVVSSDRFNASRLRTVMVSILTSNLRLASAPGNVELATYLTGLDRPSVVNVSQTTVIDRERLVEHAGTIGPPILEHVAEGLRLVLDL